MLNKATHVHKQILRCLSTSSGLKNAVHAEKLTKRSVLRVQGEESMSFLQGLITNDIEHLNRGSNSIYAMFLNKAGRVLYDTMLYKVKDNHLILESDTEVVQELRKHLMVYRIRKKVTIDNISDEFKVWSVFGSGEIKINTSQSDDFVQTFDPRLKDIGVRIITNKTDEEVLKLIGNEQEISENYNYQRHRYKLGISEGTLEIIPGKSFPLEMNLDYLHGLSVHKGCYLGQEFTARTYHTGVVRKRIMPISLENDKLAVNQEIKTEDGSSVGKIRGIQDCDGIGLLRIENALKSKELKADNTIIKTWKPLWWPQEAKKCTTN